MSLVQTREHRDCRMSLNFSGEEIQFLRIYEVDKESTR